VIGDRADISGLATYLPTGWRVTTRDRFEELDSSPDVLVLIDGSASAVRAICDRFADVPVVCTISPDAPASEAIAVLRAGADACVRSQGPLVLGAHIRACHRRRQSRALGTPDGISAISGTRAFA
jgi:hypothetical protein